MTDSYQIPAETRIGSVEIAVNNLESMIEFYTSCLGLNLLRQEDDSFYLGTSGTRDELIVLTKKKELKPPARNSPGLFHIAFLVPSRSELARVFIHLNNKEITFDGFSNHGVSEAIYLRDPEGNGIEIYCDTPDDLWSWNNNKIQMVTGHLDMKQLLSTIKDDLALFEGLHPNSKIGHIHLKVSSIEKAKKFYNETVGFNITQTDYPGALFMSAGKYHHHIGANVWTSKDTAAGDIDTLGLKKYSVVLPDLLSLNKISFRLLKDGNPVVNQNSHSLLTNDLDGIKIEFKIKQL